MNQAPRLLYPSLVVAAISVTVFSILGIAGITGHIPAALSQTADGAPAATAPTPTPPQRLAATNCANCGVIESVRAQEVKGSGSGLGAVAGGVAGALLGNQIGRGNGRTVMTLVGAGGGAYAGNEIEKNVKSHTVWKVNVRMDDGRLRQLTLPRQPELMRGAKVEILQGQILPRNS